MSVERNEGSHLDLRAIRSVARSGTPSMKRGRRVALTAVLTSLLGLSAAVNRPLALGMAGGALSWIVAESVGRRRRTCPRSGHAACRDPTPDAAVDDLARCLFESGDDIHVTYDLGSDGDVTVATINRTAARVLGCQPHDACGKPIAALVSPALARRILSDVADAARTAQAVSRHFRDVGPDGLRRVWQIRHVPITGPSAGRAGRVLGHARDVTPLRRAEADARDADLLLRMAEGVTHVGRWRVERPSGLLSWSEGTKLSGAFAPAEAAASPAGVAGLFHPDDRTFVEDEVTRALQQRSFVDFPARFVRRDGDIRSAVVRGFCRTGPDAIRSLVVMIVDVTEVRRAEARLRDNSMALKVTLDNMEQGLIMMDPGERLRICNRRALELLDLPAALMASNPHASEVLAYQMRHGEFDALTPAEIARLDPRSEVGHREILTYTRPNGTVLEIRTVPLAAGSVIKTYADVTARRRVEDALRASEAQHRILADATSDVVAHLDLNLGRRYVSAACRRVLGYDPDELIGRPALSLTHPDDIDQARDTAERLARGHVPGDQTSVTYRLRHKLGHWVWMEAALSLVRDGKDDRPSSIICSLRDVSERQKAAREVDKARTTAETAARVKADFLANMSHELRTPLTGILGVHDLLRSDPSLTDAQRRYVMLAHAAGQSLLTIVNDVLDFSKIEAGEMTFEAVRFDLAALIEGCRDLAAEQARAKGIGISASVGEGSVALVGDPTRLRQVILNLVTNAVKFTERGGVEIDASYDALSSTLRVEVRDSGIGIPADKLPSLFDRFTQADSSTTRRYGGTGLGLAICKRLVELMDGFIGVDSRPGTGSTFHFEVPLTQARRAPSVGVEPATVTVGKRGRILLAEDNPINQEIICAMLGRRGHEVVVVDDGEAAAAAVRAGPSFALVLMDLQMPVMDGLAATREIRAVEARDGRARIPVVGLTANAMPEDVDRCRAAGMDAHVAKPVRWDDLFAVLDRLDPIPSGASAVEQLGVVLDDDTLEVLAGYIGRDRVSNLLVAFAREVEARMSAIFDASEAELSACAHVLMSFSGQLGFLELSRTCSRLDADMRDGRRQQALDRICRAAERALRAAAETRHAAA